MTGCMATPVAHTHAPKGISLSEPDASDTVTECRWTAFTFVFRIRSMWFLHTSVLVRIHSQTQPQVWLCTVAAFFSLKRPHCIQKRPFHSGNLNSETPGETVKTCLYTGEMFQLYAMSRSAGSQSHGSREMLMCAAVCQTITCAHRIKASFSHTDGDLERYTDLTAVMSV